MATATKASKNGSTNRIKDKLPEAPAVETVAVKPLRMRILKLRIRGTAPYMMLRFSQKAMNTMMETMAAGTQAKSKKKREPRDFDEDYKQAFHRLPDGSAGIPASSLRAGCISACRMVGFKMTHAKLSIFIEADGFDVVDGLPLIRIHGTPEKTIMPVRNANGAADLRVRPMWREWYADIRVRFDEDQFSATDAVNLLSRVGAQVGIGEGRPDSKESCGLGYGTFEIEQ